MSASENRVGKEPAEGDGLVKIPKRFHWLGLALDWIRRPRYRWEVRRLSKELARIVASQSEAKLTFRSSSPMGDG